MTKEEVERYVDDTLLYDTEVLDSLDTDDAFKISQALLIKVDKLRTKYANKIIINKMKK